MKSSTGKKNVEIYLYNRDNHLYEPVNKELTKPNVNYNELKGQIITEILTFVFERTGRRPIIVPVILDVKK